MDQDLLDNIDEILDFKDSDGDKVDMPLGEVVQDHWLHWSPLFEALGEGGCLTQIKTGSHCVHNIEEGGKYLSLQNRIRKATTIAPFSDQILPDELKYRRSLTKKMRRAAKKILMNYAKWQMKVRETYGSRPVG